VPIKCFPFSRVKSSEPNPLRGRSPQKQDSPKLREVSPTSYCTSKQPLRPFYHFKDNRDERVHHRDVSPNPVDIGPPENGIHVVYQAGRRLWPFKKEIGYMHARSLSPTPRALQEPTGGFIIHGPGGRLSYEAGNQTRVRTVISPFKGDVEIIPNSQIKMPTESNPFAIIYNAQGEEVERMPVRSTPSSRPPRLTPQNGPYQTVKATIIQNPR